MRDIACLALITVVLVSAPPVGAQPMREHHPLKQRPVFLEHLFPPEMIMRHQQDIELTSAQQEAITKAMSEVRDQMIGLQWKLEAESQTLAKLLDHERVDETAALAEADKVLEIEQQIKRAHLGMLVRIRNQLTAKQQEELSALRRKHHRRRDR